MEQHRKIIKYIQMSIRKRAMCMFAHIALPCGVWTKISKSCRVCRTLYANWNFI